MKSQMLRKHDVDSAMFWRRAVPKRPPVFALVFSSPCRVLLSVARIARLASGMFRQTHLRAWTTGNRRSQAPSCQKACGEQLSETRGVGTETWGRNDKGRGNASEFDGEPDEQGQRCQGLRDLGDP